MNTDELEWALVKAGRRVLEIQTKLHGWAVADPHRRFDDLMNLVADPAFLLIAWDRVRGDRGAKTAGVDGHTASSITLRPGAEVDRTRFGGHSFSCPIRRESEKWVRHAAHLRRSTRLSR